MKRNWLQFARALAKGARAKLAEDQQRLRAKQTQATAKRPERSATAAAR